MSKEFINIRMEKEVFEILKYWNDKRREESKKIGHKELIYKVQRREKKIIDTEYDCPDFKEIIIFDGESQSFKTIKDILDYEYFSDEETVKLKKLLKGITCLEKAFEKILESNYFEDVKLIPFEYYWIDEGYFLTLEEAEKFRKYNFNNSENSRIYQAYPSYDFKNTLLNFLNIIDNNNLFEKVEV